MGDRGWALFDLGTGLGLTARRNPALLHASARLVDGPSTARGSAPVREPRRVGGTATRPGTVRVGDEVAPAA